MGLKNIRERYSVPAKRHNVVRTPSGVNGMVLSAAKDGTHHVWVGDLFGNRKKYHPLDLDYSVDGLLVPAEKFQRDYQKRTDMFNKALTNAD